MEDFQAACTTNGKFMKILGGHGKTSWKSKKVNFIKINIMRVNLFFWKSLIDNNRK